MDANAEGNQVLEFQGLRELADLLHVLCVVLLPISSSDEGAELVLAEGGLFQGPRSASCLLAGVNEHNDLAARGSLNDLLVSDLVHEHHPLHCFAFIDPNVLLLQRDRSVGLVEVEETWRFLGPMPYLLLFLGGGHLDAQKGGYVFVVGEGSTKSHSTYGLEGAVCSLADDAGEEGFEDGASLVMEHVDLVYDHELDHLKEGSFPCLASDNVPLLGGSHDDLGFFDLVLAKLHVACEFSDFDAIVDPLPAQLPVKSAIQIAHCFSNQCLHGGDVDHLELVHLEVAAKRRPILHAILVQKSQDSEQRDIRLPCASRRTDQHVLIALKCSRVHLRLDPIQRLEWEHSLGP